MAIKQNNKTRNYLCKKFCTTTLLLVGVIFASCENGIVYEDATLINPKGWYKEDLASFDYQATDTAGTYDIIIDLRNTADYPYKNFWLFVRSLSPDGLEYKDTLECVLADNYGRWIGKPSGSMYTLPVIFQNGVKFPKLGNYHFDFAQGMRADTLKGIAELGIRIERNKTANGEK